MSKQYFSQITESHVLELANHVAFYDMGKQLTWKKFNENVNIVANSFIELGLKPGDTVSTILPQSIEFVTTFMAAATIGLIVAPLDPRYKASEILERVQKTKPKLIVSITNEPSIKHEVEKALQSYEI